MRARSIVCALGFLLAGCADLVDTELGLAATIDSASVEVTPDAVSTSVQVTYRVGDHAEGARQFQPNTIDLFVADELVASATASPPPDFEAVVMPGESRTAVFAGEATGVDDPTRLCGAEVRVVFRWTDRTTFEIGMTEAVAGSVACP